MSIINRVLAAFSGPRASFLSITRHVVVFGFSLLFSALTLCDSTHADPLEYNPFSTIGVQAMFTRIEGRMGFAQEPGGIGTLNDLKYDLGLPANCSTYGILLSVRPLEHHVLRVYGNFPEVYRGGQLLNRTLQTRTVTYPAGSSIFSEFRTGSFGAGYDLDFLVGPRMFGGLHGDFKYLELRVRMGSSGSGYEDTLAINELVPCLGAHFQTRNSFAFGPGRGVFNLGGFGRMTWGMTPNFLSYVDLSAGVAFGVSIGGLGTLEAKAGYHFESYYHNQELSAGRSFELKRDGILVSVEGLF
jgi:hypothetical protein